MEKEQLYPSEAVCLRAALSQGGGGPEWKEVFVSPVKSSTDCPPFSTLHTEVVQSNHPGLCNLAAELQMLPRCVTSGKWLHFSERQFHHLYNEADNASPIG